MTLLLTLDAGSVAHWRWLQISDGGVVRGAGIPDPVPDAIVAVVPGDTVVVHWVALPALAPAQALAAARLLVADFTGAAPDTIHVALGDPGYDGQRPVAIIDRDAMVAWRDRLADAGIGAARLVPAPLLLPLPAAGVAVRADGDLLLVRGNRLAFAAETALADLMIGDLARVAVDAASYEAGLADRAAAALDLSQGEFAWTQRWQPTRRRWRRLALIAAAIPALWLLAEAALWLRHSFAADRTEAQLVDAARSALPRGSVVDAGSARAMTAARVAALGGDRGFAALAAPLLAVIEARPQMALDSLRHDHAAGLTAVVVASDTADIAALASVPAAAVGAPHDVRGRQVVDVRIAP